jgi:signal transduction histidine kinase
MRQASGDAGMSGGLTRRVVVACGLLLVIVGAAFAVLLVAIDGMRDSADQADHSQAELSAAGALERHVVDLESGARGFVITNRARFLAPWEAARRAIPGTSARLIRLTDDEQQRRRARAIVAATRSYLEDYSIPLVAAARRGDPAASSVATTAAGTRRVDALRARFDRFVATERELVATRQDDADDDARRAVVAAGGALAASIVLLLLLGRSLERSHTQLRRAAGELTESRARVVAAGDETRRRIERDLHDGTQQRLVSLGLDLRAAEAMLPPEQTELRSQLSHTAEGLTGAIEELQEISRGIHPAILSKGGLGPALKTLARRSAIPVELEVESGHRLPEPIEAAAYYVVSEALTNAVKHSRASAVQVQVASRDGFVQVSIRDDGVGGAAPGQGSGLIGLKDRVEALGGEIEIASPSGSGTSLRVRIPTAAG